MSWHDDIGKDDDEVSVIYWWGRLIKAGEPSLQQLGSVDNAEIKV